MPDPTNPDPAPPPAPTPAPGTIRERLRDRLKAAAAKWLPYLVTVLVTYLVTMLTGLPFVPPPIPQGAAPANVAPAPMFTGWVPNPDAVTAAAAMLEFKTFAATPAGSAADPLPDRVYQWKAHQKVTGQLPPMKNQNPVGSCVGFGTTTAIERALACAVAGGTTTDRFTHFCEEVTYAGSRVEVNGGTCPIRPSRQDPHGDGSNGGWAATWATRYGMLPRGTYGRLDLTKYVPQRAWDWNYKGVPDELEPECAKFKVGGVTRCTSWDQAKRALANGYGIAVCSGRWVLRPAGRERRRAAGAGLGALHVHRRLPHRKRPRIRPHREQLERHLPPWAGRLG